MQNVKVIGGFFQGDDETKNGVFVSRKTVVVERSKIGALFRRDWVLCQMPHIEIVETNEEVTLHI